MELPKLKIGYVNFLPVYIYDRYIHLLLTGKSGTGKSSSLASWWQQDSYYKVSKVLIEPSGILAEACYSLLKGKAHYCSLKNPISINPMMSPYDPDTISEIIAEAINQVVLMTTNNDKFTVKMRGILDQEIKYCLNANRKSLLHVRDKIANRTGETETRDGILSRLNFLLSDSRMQEILCGNNSVKWGELIAKGESFIMDCSQMGADKMVFAGNIITQGIKNYFRFERPKVYRPLALYCDECQNFVSHNFFSILKEGRKYKISCVLSTQDFSNFSEPLKNVMLNVGNIVSYREGYAVSSLIAREMDIKPQDIMYIEKYHVAYATPKERGIAKVSRPPYVKNIEIKKAEPKVKSHGWFDLGSYQAETPQ